MVVGGGGGGTPYPSYNSIFLTASKFVFQIFLLSLHSSPLSMFHVIPILVSRILAYF